MTERRVFELSDLRVEHRAEGDGPSRLAGHAAVFDALSLDLGGFRERIAPGAFAASIAEDDIRALFNHDPNLVLGRNAAGTLRLAEDDAGLAIGIDLPGTQFARDLAVSIERRDITQMSFAFRTVSDEWQMIDGEPIRTLLAVQLFDVSPVTFPAYPQTDVAVRSMEAWRERMEAEQRAAVPLRRKLAQARNRTVEAMLH